MKEGNALKTASQQSINTNFKLANNKN